MIRILKQLMVILMAALTVCTANVSQPSSYQLMPLGFQLDETVDEAGTHTQHRVGQHQSQKRLREKQQLASKDINNIFSDPGIRPVLPYSKNLLPRAPDHRCGRDPPLVLG